MPPRKPPPLDKSLFVGDGPLAPGSAPLPPDPETIHPEYIIDAHGFSTSPSGSSDIFQGLSESFLRPQVRHAIEVKLDVSAEPTKEILGVKPLSIHPTVLDLGLGSQPSIANVAHGAVDIIVPSTWPLTEKEWDLLEDAVNALDKAWNEPLKTEGNQQTSTEKGKIVISGLLPPPLTIPSSVLHQSEAYAMYQGRLAQLSLNANVHLKLLPPIVEVEAATSAGHGPWWEEIKELERVLRMYISPAIETFGTHRLIFGSSPALPLDEIIEDPQSKTQLKQPIDSNTWYGVARKAITQLEKAQEAVDGVFYGNATKVYQLE